MSSRRQFLKLSGLATVAGAGVGTPILSRSLTQNGPIEIKLFFTKSQHKRLDGEIDTFSTGFESYFQQALQNTDIGNIEVSVTTDKSPVPFSENKDPSVIGRRKRLLRWYRHTRKESVELAKHSNILVNSTGSIAKGVASVPITPPCCFGIQNVGLLWNPIIYWPPSSFLEEDVFRILAHEVGHNIGLTHAHGCNQNEEEEHRSIMLEYEYAKYVGTNLFGNKVVPSGYQGHIFNPHISRNHLTL